MINCRIKEIGKTNKREACYIMKQEPQRDNPKKKAEAESDLMAVERELSYSSSSGTNLLY